MKLKYYLRGLGLGIIVTAMILVIARNINGGMSDKEIIERAEALGMVMSTEDPLFDKNDDETTENSETDESVSEDATTEESETTSKSEDGTTEESISDEETTPEEITTEEPTTEEPTTEESTTEEPTAEEPTTEEVTTEETPTVKTAVINITKGMLCMEVANILYREGIIDNAEEFNMYMRQHNYTHEILIGTYTLDSSMSFDEIADKIVRKF